jgi:hypothetical protein
MQPLAGLWWRGKVNSLPLRGASAASPASREPADDHAGPARSDESETKHVEREGLEQLGGKDGVRGRPHDG